MTKLTDEEFVAELLKDRYQNQPWYVKAFRNIWWLMLPFFFVEQLYIEFRLERNGPFAVGLLGCYYGAIAETRAAMGVIYTINEILGKPEDR